MWGACPGNVARARTSLPHRGQATNRHGCRWRPLPRVLMDRQPTVLPGYAYGVARARLTSERAQCANGKKGTVMKKQSCERCTADATYLITYVTVGGEAFHHPACSECAADGHAFVIANNDPGFAGPDSVLASITYHALPAITAVPREEKGYT